MIPTCHLRFVERPVPVLVADYGEQGQVHETRIKNILQQWWADSIVAFYPPESGKGEWKDVEVKK